MNRFRGRYSRRKSFSPNHLTVVAYVAESEVGTLVRRRNAIRRFARHQKWEVWKTFSETYENCSRNRFPALAKGLAEMKRRGIKKLLVNALDAHFPNRLASVVMCHCAAEGVELIEAIETENAESLPNSTSLGSPAYPEADRRLLNSIKRNVTHRLKGTRPGRPPIGGKASEAQIVARVIQLARQLPKDRWIKRGGKTVKRRSPAVIADTLNAEGCRRENGRKWTDDAVRAIIRRHRPEWR